MKNPPIKMGERGVKEGKSLRDEEKFSIP